MADREMTSQEAIEILGGIRAFYNIFDEYDEPKYAALSKAIFALKAEPTKHGHNLIGDTLFECSECGYYNDDTTRGTTKTFNYCPNCGAKMDLDEV